MRGAALILALLIGWSLPAVEQEPRLQTPADLPAENAAEQLSEAPRADNEGVVPRLTTAERGPGLSVSIDAGAGRSGWSNAIQILLLMTALSVAPAFLMMMTCFTRVIIVLGFTRRALGTQTLPPNQVLLGLALFLTLFIMAPTINEVYEQAYQPYIAEQIDEEQALERASGAVRAFMAQHTRSNDLALFIRIAGEQRPRTIDEVPFTTLMPAFLTSELKTAFQMGFVIFLPFLVIDMVIAALLMALGMMMLPPVVISLPFKILLFVLVDGWTLLMQGLVASYA